MTFLNSSCIVAVGMAFSLCGELLQKSLEAFPWCSISSQKLLSIGLEAVEVLDPILASCNLSLKLHTSKLQGRGLLSLLSSCRRSCGLCDDGGGPTQCLQHTGAQCFLADLFQSTGNRFFQPLLSTGRSKIPALIESGELHSHSRAQGLCQRCWSSPRSINGWRLNPISHDRVYQVPETRAAVRSCLGCSILSTRGLASLTAQSCFSGRLGRVAVNAMAVGLHGGLLHCCPLRWASSPCWSWDT
mmetsp:Transcript_16361/g.28716  ORF Transcript_16361/g.28716 Transcript_16361/m.28716 type:complete len:244 (+) Transcript_16361:258-989(+)